MNASPAWRAGPSGARTHPWPSTSLQAARRLANLQRAAQRPAQAMQQPSREQRSKPQSAQSGDAREDRNSAPKPARRVPSRADPTAVSASAPGANSKANKQRSEGTEARRRSTDGRAASGRVRGQSAGRTASRPPRTPSSAPTATQQSPRSPPARDTLGTAAADTLQCEHFAQCDGCVLSRELATPPQLLDARRYFKSLGLSDVPMVAGPVHGWRRRAKLAVRGTPGDMRIGLYEAGSHTVRPIPSCAIHHPAINKTVTLIQQVAEDAGVQPYCETQGTGLLRYLQLTVVSQAVQDAVQQYSAHNLPYPTLPHPADLYGTHTSDMDTSNDPVQAKTLADRLWAAAHTTHTTHSTHTHLHSVWLNLHSARSNALIGREGWVLCHGPPHAYEAWGGVPVCVGPGSFVQANYGAFASCVGAMRAAVPDGARHVVEMHAGVGAIGLSLSAHHDASITSLRCVEVNAEGMEPFLTSVRLLGVPDTHITTHPPPRTHTDNTAAAQEPNPAAAALSPSSQVVSSSVAHSVVSSSVAHRLTHVEYRAESAGLRPHETLTGADVVIVDPPRKGLDPALLDALTSLAWERSTSAQDTDSPATPLPPRRLLYLSCGWQALQRDAAILLGLRPAVSDNTTSPEPHNAHTGTAARKRRRRRAQPKAGTDNENIKQAQSGAVDLASSGMADTMQRVDMALRGMRGVGGSYEWVSAGDSRPRWRLVSATAFLFFPGTDSIETLAVFEELTE